MSEQEVAGLLAGAGAGFARAAELNGYPGPMHVLEFADRLALSEERRATTHSLMTQHKARARALGEQLIEAERDLDKLFAHVSRTPMRSTLHTNHSPPGGEHRRSH